MENILINTTNATLLELEKQIEAGLKTFVEVGRCLMEIKDRHLYKEKGYTRFDDYCKEQWGMERAHAYRQIEAAKIAQILSPIGDAPQTESQARELVPLAKIDKQEAIETWRELKEKHGEHITAQIIRNEVREKLKEPEKITEPSKPHVSYNSGNNEWYTPLEYIEAARTVLEEIDLDPASSEMANRTVQAGRFFSAQDDGLSQEWHGKVWMNPPYATDLIGRFCNKLASHYESGEVSEAIVLVNNATETGWFNALIEQASAVVFPKSRVRYYTPDGESGAPLQGQAVIYLGGNPDKFLRVFKPFGWGAEL